MHLSPAAGPGVANYFRQRQTGGSASGASTTLVTAAPNGVSRLEVYQAVSLATAAAIYRRSESNSPVSQTLST